MSDKQRRTRRQFTAEFKVRRRGAGPHQWPADRRNRPRAWYLRLYLGNWVRQNRIDRGEQEGLSSEERARLGELERETARLRMEPDLLKRTVAFWVKEQSTP